MPLPTNRSTSNTAAEHVSDHNALHTQHNTFEDSGWQAITLQNGWTDFGSTYTPPGYRKLGNVVYCRGIVKTGTNTAGTVVFTLPSGYRPAIDMRIIVAKSGTHSAVDVNPDGTVTLEEPVQTNDWLSFASIIFPVG